MITAADTPRADTPSSSPDLEAVLRSAISDAALMRRVGQLKEVLKRRGLNVGVSGIDGSGKTVLTRHLEAVFRAASIDVKLLAIHRWHRTVLVVPSMMLTNRWFGRRLYVFDRTIYDNLAKFFAARRMGVGVAAWLSSGLARLTRWFYPRFDVLVYMRATREEALARRTETRPEEFDRLSAMYDVIVPRAGHRVVRCDWESLETVLEMLLSSHDCR